MDQMTFEKYLQVYKIQFIEAIIMFLWSIIINLLFNLHLVDSVSYHRFPLYGNMTLSWYFIKLYFGSPPQIQSLFPDTGSALTVFPCQQCTSCHKKKRYPLFDLQASYTSKNVYCYDKSQICKDGCDGWQSSDRCPFELTYADKTHYKGEVYEDIVRFADSQGEDADSFVSKFGCVADQANSYYILTENGIMGLSHYRENIFHPWMKKLDPKKRKLGFCYAHNGGYMQIGDVEVPTQDVFKTEISTPYFYGMQAESIFFGGEQLDIYSFSRMFIIDTGATFSYLQKDLLAEILTTINTFCNDSSCYQAKNQTFRSPNIQSMTCFYIDPSIWQDIDALFPPLLFNFDSQTLIWYASNYLRHISNYFQGRKEEHHYCLGIRGGDSNIFGIHWLQGRKVVMDIGQGYIYVKQSYNCSYDQIDIPQVEWYEDIGEYLQNQIRLYIAIAFILVILICFKYRGIILDKLCSKCRNSREEEDKVLVESDNKMKMSSDVVQQQLKQVETTNKQVSSICSQISIEQV